MPEYQILMDKVMGIIMENKLIIGAAAVQSAPIVKVKDITIADLDRIKDLLADFVLTSKERVKLLVGIQDGHFYPMINSYIYTDKETINKENLTFVISNCPIWWII